MSEETIILDVSAAQGVIDWDELAASKRCHKVIIKATEGNGYVDPQFVRNVRESIRVGLFGGVYHFAHPDRREMDAREEATHFVATTIGALYGYGDISHGINPNKVPRFSYELDIEEARNIDKGPAFCEWVLTFCETVDELVDRKYICGIYTGGPFWDEHDGEPDDEVRDALKHRWLHIAAYVNDPTRYVAMTPWCERGAAMHQRSGDVSPGGKPGIKYPGIEHNVVDTNVFLMGDWDRWVESQWLDDAPLMYPDTNIPQAVDFVRGLVDTEKPSV
jgi:hypothetical protein